jgi:hypothetical protein
VNSHDPRTRRSSPRVVGPFNARWVGTVKVPLVVHDLSLGGCFILSARALQLEGRMTLEIDLPDKTTVTLEAKPLNAQRSKGFAVQFVDVPALTLLHLQRSIATLAASGP